MDAEAYLQRHGWTGGGLGYQQHGIKKPILASQKHGFQKGLGGKPLGGHSDQWWLGAFDAGLKNLGSDNPTAVAPAINRGPAYFKAELYRNFVQGKGLTGTMEEAERALLREAEERRKMGLMRAGDKIGETSEESSGLSRDEADRKAGKKERKEKRVKRRAEKAHKGTEEVVEESREERRARKVERRARREERRKRKLVEQAE